MELNKQAFILYLQLYPVLELSTSCAKYLYKCSFARHRRVSVHLLLWAIERLLLLGAGADR